MITLWLVSSFSHIILVCVSLQKIFSRSLEIFFVLSLSVFLLLCSRIGALSYLMGLTDFDVKCRGNSLISDIWLCWIKKDLTKKCLIDRKAQENCVGVWNSTMKHCVDFLSKWLVLISFYLLLNCCPKSYNHIQYLCIYKIFESFYSNEKRNCLLNKEYIV